jgi:hypothetical protein
MSKPPFPEVRRGVEIVRFSDDPCKRLDELLRLSQTRRSIIAYATSTPTPSALMAWMERRGIDILIAIVGGAFFGVLLGVAYMSAP